MKFITLSLTVLLTIPLFSQNLADNKGIVRLEAKATYLDSIKKTFIKDDLATCVDHLWMKELTDQELFNDMSNDLATIDGNIKVDYDLSTDLLKSRLAAMNAKSPFRIQYNENLENVIKSFLKNRKKSFERLMGVSEYYFPMFEEALAKKNVPLEIKYLAIVESALNANAVSRVGATGLWQFMYQTGKQYGLNIDSYLDERSDPLRSSDAAADYMSKMHAIFGDWELVLASYNSGPGNVSKAIRRSGGKQNFWDIKKYLPKETQNYVPAFLATMYIYEYHKEHGIVPQKADLKHFETDTVKIKKEISFAQLSELLDVPVNQLQLLNPSYKLNVIPVYGAENHFLRLPKAKLNVFVSNEDKIYAYIQNELNGKYVVSQNTNSVAETNTQNTQVTKSIIKYYKVRRGDALSEIADKYNVSSSDIKKWNRLRRNTIASGKRLKIFVDVVQNQTSIAATNTPKTQLIDKKIVKNITTAKEAVATTTATEDNKIYIVQKGDNLGSIAKSNNIDVTTLMDLNKLTNQNLSLGMKLIVSDKNATNTNEVASSDLNSKTKNTEYKVLKGDNLGAIAQKFNVSLEDLKLWNDLNSNQIKPGSCLIVCKETIVNNTIALASVNSFKKTEHSGKDSKKIFKDYYVKKGDSLYSIAKKYPGVTISDLKQWNGIRKERLKPGMKLKVIA
ncbi:MAG: rane-bound lytic murein transglycosylase [Bacteroidota bacterium]|nr:rane-bound lytic murein transglycosylase [Bacteroidota bacterium]